MIIEGFKKVDYKSLIKELIKAYQLKAIPDVEIATNVNVRSVQTVKNSMNLGMQMVADETLSKIFYALGLSICITWVNGVRSYYLKIK
ncbi:MAG: hypothetical protein ABIP68_06740 [Ferruginibacter sp.]